MTLGEVSAAVVDAEQSVTYADRSGDAFMRMAMRTTHADALHQSGRRSEAETLFGEAEQMQAAFQPAYPLLYSLSGFRYCDLLLAPSERAAWRATLECGDSSPLSIVAERLSFSGSPPSGSRVHTPPESPSAKESGSAANQSGDESPDSKVCRAVAQRAMQTLKWVEAAGQDILSAALDRLTLGRALLYGAILTQSEIQNPNSEIESAVSGLRSAGQQIMLPHGLLTRAWHRSLTGRGRGESSAESDLEEAWEIASRGSMRLFMADVLLTRARLFGIRHSSLVIRHSSLGTGDRPNDQGPMTNDQEQLTTDYHWGSAEADLAAAEKLIAECGYHRRDEELADATRALLGKA